MNWPEFFPDDCPYDHADLAHGKVFRLIKGDEPNKDDFKSHRETQRHKDFNQPKCIVCGLSVYKNWADVLQLKRRIPAMRKKLAASATLNQDLGKILHTPSSQGETSHHTWWVPIKAKPWENFQVVISEVL